MKLMLMGIVMGFLVSCGPGNPETYGECLVDLGQTRTAADAMLLCRQAFPEPPAPEPVVPFYVGDFFYPPPLCCPKRPRLKSFCGVSVKADPLPRG